MPSAPPELQDPAGGRHPGAGPWRRTPLPDGFAPFPDAAVDGSVAARFLATAAEHASRDALRSPAGSWTYAELERDARRRAAGIAAAVDGVEPRPVALLVDHDGPLVVTVLATALAGHIVVVLDPLAPAEQTAHALAESGAELLLHDAGRAEAAAALAPPGHGPRVEALDSVDELGDPGFGPPARSAADPLMLAFTSGTSGDPKAAVVTNGVLLNLVRGATNALGVGPEDRMPMLFPTSLAVAAYPMFLPLLNGGTLATLDVRSVGLAPVADFLEQERITLAYMAPTVVRFLVDALAGRTFPHLRMIALGGEVVDAEVVRTTTELFGPDLVANGFGTTETGVITLYVLDPGEEPEGAVPAGYPVPDVDLFVLDDQGRTVAPGTAGEVAVASPYVFSGYWGHPELTALVLADDPAGRPGWSLYRTGDLGRLDEHGALTVLGRLDTKVKVRGRFVVLGDVEADLHELPEVGAAVVTSHERGGVVELVATVTAATDEPIDVAALRARLLATSEAYRVPSRWQVVDELPRLPNGKVDRRALGDAGSPAADPTAAPSPTDDLEQAFARTDAAEADVVGRELRDLWELLLPVPLVGVDDDFFHLGGDSLLAAQMLVLAEQRLGTTVPMGELVHARTIRDLTDVVLRIRRIGQLEPSTVACVQAGDEDARPRLWFVHDLQGSAFRVRHLAEHLGPDQPVWSFESPLLRGAPNVHTSLDTFVARYVRDLRAAQPEGPYWLAGYSFGGICAYEMARQLRRDGEEVAFLGVVDVGPGYRGPGWGDGHAPFRPWFGVAKPPPPGSTPAQALRHYRAMAEASPKGALRHLMVRTGLAERIDPLRFRADLRRHGRVRPEWRLWYAWEEHWRLAARSWDRSKTYEGRLDLFWADDSASADASLGWAPLVGELEVRRFPGDHEGILEPGGAPALATALRDALDTAVARAADHPQTHPEGP